MALQMFAPVWLAVTAPLTLALRVLPTSGRRALVRVLHSPFVYRFMMIFGVGVSHILLGVPVMMGTQQAEHTMPWWEARPRDD